MATVLAIDIGGTKMAAGVVDDAGRILVADQVPTPQGGDADELWAALTGVIAAVRSAAPIQSDDIVAAGVGCGGPMTPSGELVSPLNIHGWRGFPLRSRLGEWLGLPVHVDNDAKALALGEGWVGGAVGTANYMAMVVSTGVGGGIVVDGRLLDGASGNAGHIGHVVVEPDGATLPGHAQGTLEVEASGTGIAAAFGMASQHADAATIERVGRMVGRAAGSTCNLLDLSIVLVAGSVALGFGAPFFAAAQAEMDRICVLDFSRTSTIGPAGLGADGPLVGAAAVAWRKLGVDIGVR